MKMSVLFALINLNKYIYTIIMWKHVKEYIILKLQEINVILYTSRIYPIFNDK